jgi:hypothetical protein
MRRGEFEAAGDRSPDELRAAYEAYLADRLEEVGLETAVAETDLDRAALEALQGGEAGDWGLDEAAELLAVADGVSADVLAAEARDILLMGMTTAVMDVEALASAIDESMEAKAIQQKIEGRRGMTLAEYAVLHHQLEAETP